MKFDEYLRLKTEHARLENAYKAAVQLLLFQSTHATDQEFSAFKMSVDELKERLDRIRAQLDQRGYQAGN